ncbi:MAG: amino acid ABC transporter permease [Oscillospiraceae bacterium]|nr:amino acid ABC transporter permease [Oscillospiraceae bacterium]
MGINPTAGQIFKALLEGFWVNLEVFAVTPALAIPLGFVISFGSMSKFRPLRCWDKSDSQILRIISKFAPIKLVTRTFVWIIRGTPLMLQLFVVYYGPGLLFQTPFRSPMTAVLIAFVINYAAYFSEIFRGGIEGISKGQYEACQVLGMTKSQTFFKVVLMQVVKRTIPPMSNEIITLVKDTSLARVVSGVTEILHGAYNYTRMGLIWPLFSTGLFFLAFNGILTLLFGYIEKKLDYYKG